jgi:hypothetical protein
MRKTARAGCVGMYRCPNPVHQVPVWAAMRQKNNDSKTLYGFCGGALDAEGFLVEQGCGMTNWNMKAGQEFFLNQEHYWGPSGTPPDDAPAWIKANSAWGPKGPERPQPEETRVPTEKPAPLAEPLTPVPAAAPQQKPAVVAEPFKFPWEA